MGFWGQIRDRLFGRKRPETEGIVLLLRSPRAIPVSTVRQAFQDALGPEADLDSLATMGEISFSWKSAGWHITGMAFPTKYVPDKFIDRRDARMAEALEEHQAAILFHIHAAPEGKDRATDGVNLVGQLIAPLMDEETIAVYSLGAERINLANEELKAAFSDGKAVEAMEYRNYDPVVTRYKQKKMDEAVAEARRRWPEFLAAYEARTCDPEEVFIAKFPFGQDPHVEHMWISVESIDGDTVNGRMENKPMFQPGLKEGDPVTGSVERLSDWLYASEKGAEGGFTQRVLQEM
jgi:uncharacterized protein YegJ (DUF2314 family)